MGQGLGLPHKGSLRAAQAVEAWFGTSTVASLAQPSGVGESSGNEGSGDTLTVQQRDVAWGPETCSVLLWHPPPPPQGADSGGQEGAVPSLRERARL